MDEAAKVKKALKRLETLPKTLKKKTEEIMSQKRIVTRLDAEHEFKILAADIFGSDEASDLNKIIVNYLENKYHEIKTYFHEAVMSRENYLEGLLTLLENPGRDDEEIKYTDSFSSFEKEVPDRWGLENELLDYLESHPESFDTTMEKAHRWILGEYPASVESSGYRIIGDHISINIKDEQQLKNIRETEYLFIEGLNSKEYRTRKNCLSILGGFIAVQQREGLKSEAYAHLVRISKNSDDFLAHSCKRILEILD